MSDTVVSTKPQRGSAERGISFKEAFKVWLRMAALSFGRPMPPVFVTGRLASPVPCLVERYSIGAAGKLKPA
ncbi:hypothetical protein ABID20_003703 [Rhizobium alvei]